MNVGKNIELQGTLCTPVPFKNVYPCGKVVFCEEPGVWRYAEDKEGDEEEESCTNNLTLLRRAKRIKKKYGDSDNEHMFCVMRCFT